MRVMFDLDGVLADWILAFTALANQIQPGCIPVWQGDECPHWLGREHFTPPEMYDEAWRVLLDTPCWWETVPPLVSKDVFQRVNRLCMSQEVYFITDRHHNRGGALKQTANWLTAQGISWPFVVLTGEKWEACRVLKIDFSLEDRWENALDITTNSPRTRSFLLDRLYNRERVGPRVKTVRDFVDFVEAR